MYVIRSPMAGFRRVLRPASKGLMAHTAGSAARAAAASPARVKTPVVPHRTTFVAVTAYSTDGCLKIYDKGYRIWVPLRERVSRSTNRKGVPGKYQTRKWIALRPHVAADHLEL